MLGEGCPSTALAFNMHASVVMPLLESAEVTAETKRRLADLVVQQGKLIAAAAQMTMIGIKQRQTKEGARSSDGRVGRPPLIPHERNACLRSAGQEIGLCVAPPAGVVCVKFSKLGMVSERG